MYCSKCGAEVGEGSSFCSKCGAQMAEGTAAQQAYTQPPVQPQQGQPYRNYQPYQPYQQQPYQRQPYQQQPYQQQPYQPYYPVPYNSGSNMLKAASILFIISGGLSTLLVPLLIALYHAQLEAVSVIGTILACLMPITAGVIGLRKYKDTSAGLFFIVAGAVMLPLMIVFVAMMSIGMHSSYYEITYYPGLASIVLPIIFIVGGVKLKGSSNVVVYPPRPDNF